MIRMKTVACLAIAACSLSGAQQPDQGRSDRFTFKDNYLGMPLSEFKEQNRGMWIWIWGRDANRKKFKKEVQTPLCTDSYYMPSAYMEDRAEGEQICDVAPGQVNVDMRTVADQPLDSVYYRFYRGKLYRIDLFFNHSAYDAVQSAFVRKYGPPATRDSQVFQNGFGAVWDAAQLFWGDKRRGIAMSEGSGRFGSGVSIALIEAFDLAPPDREKPPLDF